VRKKADTARFGSPSIQFFKSLKKLTSFRWPLNK